MANTSFPVYINYRRDKHSDQTLFQLYRALLLPRLYEEKMLLLLRQGRISKWFSGIGQEGIAVGATQALEQEDYIFPMHRNLGVFTSRGVSLSQLFAQFQGKPSGFSKGRDRSFHFGIKEKRLVGMISHLGPQMSLACGVALAHKLKNEKRVTLAFCGDGATSEGEFHEALNLAAVWDLPVIFIIENNSYGLSTPNYEQFRCKHLVDKGIGYGIEAKQIDGNNVLEVYETVNAYADQLRYDQRPVLIEAMTFRMRGHEEASGTKYVPQHLFEEWGLKDPVANFENYLVSIGVLTPHLVSEARELLKEEINEAVHRAFQAEEVKAQTDQELEDVYAPYLVKPEPENIPQNAPRKRFIDAISEGLRQSLERNPSSVLMGQDVAEYGGVFKVSEGFVEQFGKARIRNTPLCESAVIGAGLGLSIAGYKAIVEMQFADFVTCGFNQIINNLAKIHYRWGQNADVVIRMPTGAGVAAGPFHSQSNEAWFVHTPGLKVVYPSNPYDAKGLLAAAIDDPNPVLFFEHKKLYRSLQGEVPDAFYTLEIGKGKRLQSGEDLSIITYGYGVVWAKEAIERLGIQGQVDLIDLRSLLPWDKELVRETVLKTGKVLICHEDCLTGGIGGEIAAWIAEHCFQYLDAPIMREASLDTPVPFAPALEENFLPYKRIEEKITQLLAF